MKGAKAKGEIREKVEKKIKKEKERREKVWERKWRERKWEKSKGAEKIKEWCKKI